MNQKLILDETCWKRCNMAIPRTNEEAKVDVFFAAGNLKKLFEILIEIKTASSKKCNNTKASVSNEIIKNAINVELTTSYAFKLRHKEAIKETFQTQRTREKNGKW